MPTFDPDNIFSYNVSTIADSPLTVATKFGMPECILQWEKTVMALLPSDLLLGLNSGLEQGVGDARAFIADILNALLEKWGIKIFDEQSGLFVLQSELQRKFGAAGAAGLLGELGNALGAIMGAGATLYENYQIMTETWDKLEACWDEFEEWIEDDDDSCEGVVCPDGYVCENGVCVLPFSSGDNPYVGAAERAVKDSREWIEQAQNLQNIIAEVLNERLHDPSLIPRLVDASAVSEAPIFDLVYGPPVMKKGQLLYSTDGLYYNSQTADYGGHPVPQASDIGFVPDPEKWKLNHFASLGGRGESYSITELGEYVDTLFDPDQVYNGKDILPYYDADHFLNVLINQKTKDVYDVSSQINDLVVSGYTTDSAMVVNLRQSLYSTISNHNIKINKRKKQLEVAAKAPDLFGSESFEPGKVPINDFSFLKNINLAVDIKKQRKLTFVQGEVSSVVLPLNPKFVRAVDSESQPLVSHLTVPRVGKGAITYRNSSTNPEASSTVEVFSITDNIASNGLFAVYNFLDGKVATPESSLYQVLNCATPDNYNNCQLVSVSAQDIFRKGVGIPFLRGIPQVGFNPISMTPSISSTGNYLKMPSTPEFQNLFYNQAGASIDLWLHLPNFNELVLPYSLNSEVTDSGDGKYSTFQYHKLLLACENTGGDDLDQVSTEITAIKGSQTVRGLVIGFSREKQLYRPKLKFAPIGDFDENEAVSTGEGASKKALSVFYIAPTQSVNTKDVEFLNRGECYNPAEGQNIFAIETAEEINGVKFDDAKTSFIHLNISFDIEKDLISVYLDGKLHSTARVTATFGSEVGKPIQLPTFYAPSSVTTSSFQYAKDTVTQEGTHSFDQGPLIGGHFTPWIVGGGWTDGIPKAYNSRFTSTEGGFMSSNHGLRSGLDGYIGSLKFYSRPLNINEVKQNYNTQKDFFKNIKL